MALPKYEGAFILTATTQVGTFAGAAVSIAAATYYLTSTTNLLSAIKTAADTATGRTWTLTLDDTSDTATGKVTISVSGAATTVTWSSTDIRNALGFAGNLSSGTSWTSDNQAKYLWLPNCGRSGIMAPQASTGAIESDYTLARGSDGTPYAWATATRSIDTMEHRTVLGRKMWTTKETTVNEAFETFYRVSIAAGRKIRFYKDRSDDATYRTWVAIDGGTMQPTAVREDWADGANSLWSIRYSVGETS